MYFKAIDLFSGCGGMSLGFQRAGFEILAAVDKWPGATRIYRENFDHPIYEGDLTDGGFVQKLTNLGADLIMGGPPCQDYSIAGKRKLGERANLTIRFAEIVSSAAPEWVVFENVYNIEKYSTLTEMVDILKKSGYGITTKILDASLCGVPQKRKRFFLVGRIGEPDGFFDDFLTSGLADKPMTVRDYLGGSLGTEYYYMHPRSYNRRAVFSIDEPASTIRGINRPIPKTYVMHPGDKARIEEGVRALTTRERALLQTFPPDFRLPGPKTDVELAIGNAVPPALAEYIGRRIYSFQAERASRKD